MMKLLCILFVIKYELFNPDSDCFGSPSPCHFIVISISCWMVIYIFVSVSMSFLKFKFYGYTTIFFDHIYEVLAKTACFLEERILPFQSKPLLSGDLSLGKPIQNPQNSWTLNNVGKTWRCIHVPYCLLYYLSVSLLYVRYKVWKIKNLFWAIAWQNWQSGKCSQKRLMQAWTAAQSDLLLKCAAKTLIRFGGWFGRSNSLLGTHDSLLALLYHSSFCLHVSQ